MISFKGEVSSDIITMILQVAENKLDAIDEKGLVRKKIFNILVECLQNLYHHAEPDLSGEGSPDIRPGMIEVWYDNDFYYIQIGNFIFNKNVENVRSRIEKINNFSKDELRAYYKEILDNDQISKKGGAGLGMIDIARKSGEKLEIFFDAVNDKVSFLSLKIKVSKN
jgi:hypothetical protein